MPTTLPLQPTDLVYKLSKIMMLVGVLLVLVAAVILLVQVFHLRSAFESVAGVQEEIRGLTGDRSSGQGALGGLDLQGLRKQAESVKGLVAQQVEIVRSSRWRVTLAISLLSLGIPLLNLGGYLWYLRILRHVETMVKLITVAGKDLPGLQERARELLR